MTMVSGNAPDIASQFRNNDYEATLREILSNGPPEKHGPFGFDIVQIEGLELAHTIPIVRKMNPGAQIVYDAHNAESELQRRAYIVDLSEPLRWPAAAYSMVQRRRLKRYESWACRSVDWVTAVSESDASHLTELSPELNPTVIPNCIDIESLSETTVEKPEEHDLIFVGKMDYRPNVDAVLWFADKIWPIIARSRPQTTWAIIGQRPHPRLRRLRTMAGVTVTGFVDQLQPYYAGSKVVVVPLRMGSGTRLKLLEAMASSKALVSTSLGAEGFPGIGGEAVAIEDDPSLFAKAVLSLLENPEERIQLGMAGRRYAEDYDWRRIMPRFEEVYTNLFAVD
jgi:glycosyltransferase involved in cell wall biosynthesis